MPQETEEQQLISQAVMANDISYIKGSILKIEKSLDEMKRSYITREEFAPVKNLVYGLVGIILLTVVGALISLVVRK